MFFKIVSSQVSALDLDDGPALRVVSNNFLPGPRFVLSTFGWSGRAPVNKARAGYLLNVTVICSRHGDTLIPNLTHTIGFERAEPWLRI